MLMFWIGIIAAAALAAIACACFMEHCRIGQESWSANSIHFTERTVTK